MKLSDPAKKKLLFFIPFLSIVIGICCVEPPPDYRFRYLKNDCESQPAWIYQNLHGDSKKLDLVFFGTSHTLNGVNDSVIRTMTGVSCANLGYCRFGRDLQYEFFRQLLEQKEVGAAVFEVSEIEPSYSHPVYPYLAPRSEVFAPALLYNQDFYHNRAEAFLMRLSYLRSKFYPGKDSALLYHKNFGFIANPGKAEPKLLEEKKINRKADLEAYEASKLVRKAELSFSAHYFEKIRQLAAAHNCKVYFLYLPSFGASRRNPLDSALYAQYFPILVPPDSLLGTHDLWSDPAHFNIAGSTLLSRWLARKFSGPPASAQLSSRCRLHGSNALRH